MFLLHLRRLRKWLMFVKNCFRKSCRAGRKINRSEIFFRYAADHRLEAWAIVNHDVIALRETRTVVADVNQQASFAKSFSVGFDAPDKFRTENYHVDFGQLRAIQNFCGIVAEVERHGNRARLEHAEINRQPLQAVVHQNRNFIAFAHAAFD